MKCQRESCDRDATVHFTELVNGVKKEIHFCEQCSNQQLKSVKTPFGLGDLFFVIDPNDKTKTSPKEDKCSSCGWTYEDFRKEGKFGCPDCYSVFSTQITPILKRIHNETQHRGKSPRKSISKEKAREQLKELESQLSKAIAEEAFEKAAKLRDEIRVLKDA